MKRYISIDLSVMVKNNLTMGEWALLENVHFLSANEFNSCYASKEELRKHLGVSNGQIYKIISRLCERKYLKKMLNGHLKVTEKWMKIASGDSLQKMENSSGDYLQKMEKKSPENGDLTIKDGKEEREEEEEEKNLKNFTEELENFIEFLKNENGLKINNKLSFKNKLLENFQKKDRKTVLNFSEYLQSAFFVKSKLLYKKLNGRLINNVVVVDDQTIKAMFYVCGVENAMVIKRDKWLIAVENAKAAS